MSDEAQSIIDLSQSVANLTQALADALAENEQLRQQLQRLAELQPQGLRSRTAAPRGR